MIDSGRHMIINSELLPGDYDDVQAWPLKKMVKLEIIGLQGEQSRMKKFLISNNRVNVERPIINGSFLGIITINTCEIFLTHKYF